MGMGIFWDCRLMKEIIIPGGVKKIADCTFLNCSSLESLTIKDGVETIGSKPFINTKVSTLTIPESVCVLDSFALSEMLHLDTLRVAWKKPLTLQPNVFEKTPMKHLRVPRGCAAAYRQADVWKDFNDISEY